MAQRTFDMQVTFPVSPDQLYSAWLDSHLHSDMTLGEAHCSDRVGESFTAWDGYITGKNLRLEPNQLIIQSWRTMDFLEEDPDSRLELRFEPAGEGCLLTLIHSDISDGQRDYEQGWEDHYFTPMKAYFNR